MKTLLDATHGALRQEHACSIYNDPTEQLASVVPFLRAGLDRGERCLYVAENQHKFVSIVAALNDAGVSAEAALGSRAVILLTEPWAGYRQTALHHTSLSGLFREEKANALRDGYTGVCVAIEMDWISDGAVATENAFIFERRLALVVAETGSCAL